MPLSSVQFSRSVVSDSLRPYESQHARPPCPSPTPGVHSLTSIESVMPSSHLILCRPLLLLPSIPPSITVFSNESTLRMRWPKYWSFSFSISPSKEHPGLISFKTGWFDLLAVQGTLNYLWLNRLNGNPLQCSCLENPGDGGAWWAAVYGVAQSRTRLKRLSSSSAKKVPPPTSVSPRELVCTLL